MTSMAIQSPISPPTIQVPQKTNCISTGVSVSDMQPSTEFECEQLFVEFTGGHSALHGSPYSHSSFLCENLTFGILLPLPLHQQPRIVIGSEQSGKLMAGQTTSTE